MWIESFGLWRVQVSSWSSEYMMSISPLFLSDIIRIFCCFSPNFWQVCQLHPQKKHSNIIKDHKHIYSQRSLQFILIKYATKSFQSTEIVPESDERKSKKETEGSPEFCHQGGAWVDQFLSLHPGPVGRGARYIDINRHFFTHFCTLNIRIFSRLVLFSVTYNKFICSLICCIYHISWVHSTCIYL